MATQGSRPRSTPYVGTGRNGLMTEADARALLDELAQSGMTQTEFAERKGFNAARLSWWRSKFAGKHTTVKPTGSGSKTSRPAVGPRFVPVVAERARRPDHGQTVEAAVPTPRGGYELAVGGALTLRIPEDFHDETLARIVRVLRQAR